MISLGSVRWTSEAPNITLSFAYEKQRSGANMQYRAQITVSTVSGSSYFGYPIYLGLSIGGTLRETKTLKDAYPSRWTSEITYTSAWYTISNKTTGTTPVSFNVYSGLGSSRSATYSYDMGVDPAASVISASNGTLGTALTLSLTRYNANFTDTITYKCGNTTGTVVSNSKATSVAWNTSNGNTVALAANNTSGRSVTVTFTVTTYSGSTPVGTNSVNVTMAIPSSVKPSVALSITDATGYLSTYGAYVQGFSKLKITATPTLAQGSPIKTYLITADGASYPTSPVTTPAIKGKGTLTITARVTDTRECSSDTVSQNITVLEYVKPVVNVSAYRCNSNGTANPEGSYMKIAVTSTISNLNGKNSATYKVVHSGGTVTGNGTSYTSGALACDVSSTHNIEVTITDKLSSTTRAAVVPVAYTLLDYYQTGKGIAFGKVGTRDGFDCAMPSYFGNNRLQEVGSPISNTDAVNLAYLKSSVIQNSVKLTSADNLNNIRSNGWYTWSSDSKPINVPSVSGTAYMSAMLVTVSGNSCLQEVFDVTDSTSRGCSVQRNIYGATAYDWEWHNPPMENGVEYRTTENWLGLPVYTMAVRYSGLPNAATLEFTHPFKSSGLRILNWTGYLYNDTSGECQPLVGNASVTILVAKTTLYVTTTRNLSGYPFYIAYKYTK